MRRAARRSPTGTRESPSGGSQAPTLVIAGAHDVATPPSDAEYLAESIPGARLAILDHAAHLANVEQPEAFDRVLLEHLAVPVAAEKPA